MILFINLNNVCSLNLMILLSKFFFLVQFPKMFVYLCGNSEVQNKIMYNIEKLTMIQYQWWIMYK